MENSEKQMFEKSWREAFREAEQTPSEQVWMGVEHALDAAEAGMMKRRVVFYKRLAAAAVVFALVAGGLTAYYVIDQQQTAERLTSKENEAINEESITGNNPQDNNQLSKKDQAEDSSIKNDATLAGADETLNGNIPSVKTVADNKVIKDDAPLFIAPDDSGNQPVLKTNREVSFASHLSSLGEPEIKLKGKMREVTLARKLPAMPASFMAESGNKKSRPENLWAALGASVGNYSPTSNLSSADVKSSFNYQAQNRADANQTASSSSSSRGSMVSLGMNMGKRISDRWLLQGGVSYFTQSIDYTSNYAVLDANNRQTANVANYGSLKSFAIVPTTAPYQVNSVNQFISVPLQAGYMIIDRKIGWQLNSGVATDFFFQNTLSDKSGLLASYSSGPGEDSPYRAISWAGLMGTELSYKLGDQYRFSVAPGLRYSINSVLKSDSYNPLVWDVGFRLRYIFK
jgi:hypothetical protein